MPEQPILRRREKFAYGFGDFASCLYWKSISDYLNIFYTDVFGITALAAGTMLGVSRSFDALFDVAWYDQIDTLPTAQNVVSSHASPGLARRTRTHVDVAKWHSDGKAQS